MLDSSSLFELSGDLVTLPRVIRRIPGGDYVGNGSVARCTGLIAATDRAEERSQSRRRSAARSMACERDATPSFW